MLRSGLLPSAVLLKRRGKDLGRSCQVLPGVGIGSQEQQGADSSIHEQQGAARSRQEQPEAAKGSNGQPGRSRPPKSPRMPKHGPRVSLIRLRALFMLKNLFDLQIIRKSA